MSPRWNDEVDNAENNIWRQERLRVVDCHFVVKVARGGWSFSFVEASISGAAPVLQGWANGKPSGLGNTQP
jgi:hypothetical protein